MMPTAAQRQPVPSRLSHEGNEIVADWADIVGTRRDLPLLSDRVAAAVSTWRAPLPAAGPAPRVAGLILHTGRCGSTLVSRSLAVLPRCHLLAEPVALNNVLSVDGRWPFLPAAERLGAARRVVDALARSSGPGQDCVVLKLSSWNTLHLSLIEEVLPTVPIIFLYRRPDEILASLREGPAPWMQRALDIRQAGLFLRVAPSRVPRTPLAFAAEVIRRGMQNVVQRLADSSGRRWLLVSHDMLPEAISARIVPWLQLTLHDEDHALLAQIARFHAKYTTHPIPFRRHHDRKERGAPSGDLAALTGELMAAFDQLESLRRQAARSTP